MPFALTGLTVGVAAATYGFGFRHGLDWDHLAALTDLTSSERSARRSMRLATLYAVGHSVVVFVLGVVAIWFAEELPSAVDEVMVRVVGATLIALGVYVWYGVARHGSAFRMRSRWMLIFDGVAKLRRRDRTAADDIVVIEHDHPHDHDGAHGHDHGSHDTDDPDELEHSRVGLQHHHVHRHFGSMPADPDGPSGRAAFLIGVVHGVGAETPTQVVLFITAAGAAGRTTGVALLFCFLGGLLTANTLVGLVGTAGILSASRNRTLYLTVSLFVGAASLVVGALFLFGQENAFPTLFGG